eukprot:Phypoly_transcript_25489.p1 GENE.Phypoly_transcript_25489~~Phypoly_transcript_25489.p1  ORF type:complete len:112 (+),score=17.24 Phypoly_transcript_25489:24-338(+)
MANRSSARAPSPPEKGSFPLDHKRECWDVMSKYLECLKDKEGDSIQCKPQAKDYLSCRIDKGLMLKEDLDALGFYDPTPNVVYEKAKPVEGERVAGLRPIKKKE